MLRTVSLGCLWDIVLAFSEKSLSELAVVKSMVKTSLRSITTSMTELMSVISQKQITVYTFKHWSFIGSARNHVPFTLFKQFENPITVVCRLFIFFKTAFVKEAHSHFPVQVQTLTLSCCQQITQQCQFTNK